MLIYLQVAVQNTVQVDILFNLVGMQIVHSLQKTHVHWHISQTIHTSVSYKCYLSFLLIFEHNYKQF